MADKRPTTYWDYIRVEDLLALQGGIEHDPAQIENDEVVFITVHQVFELWFQLVLRELRSMRDLFCAPFVSEQELSGAVRSVKRINTILRMSTQHWEVVETLTTREYLAFRDKLMGASGFQSAQLRQIEILMGLEESQRIPLGIEGSYKDALKTPTGAPSPSLERVERQLADLPTLKGAVESWLLRTPIDGVTSDGNGGTAHVDSFVERFLAAHARETERTFELASDLAVFHEDEQSERGRLRARYDKEKQMVREFLNPSGQDAQRKRGIRVAILFIVTYRELPLLAWPRELLDGLVEMEQLFVIFRQRHARMVERVIGRRTGTGGSAGVEYLDKTALEYRVFEDLWAMRTLQIRRLAAPELEQPEFYGFRTS